MNDTKIARALAEAPAWRDAIVCEKMKVVYLPLAKVNCTGLKRLFMRIDGDPRWCSDYRTLHDCNKNFLRNLPEHKQQLVFYSSDWKIFTVVREPYTRFKSCFLDKCGPNGDVDVYKGLSAKDFVNKVCGGEIRENHSMTQTECLGIPSMISFIDIIGTLGTLEGDLHKLCAATHFDHRQFMELLQSGWGSDKKQPFFKVRAPHATDSAKKENIFGDVDSFDVKRIMQFLKPDYDNFAFPYK